ncbi:MAG: helix-turn-helix transcriptional regulator [Clostridiales bacterium]|nr:helix-turn-helix transcriptional regulator [Clostridiales bacterium]
MDTATTFAEKLREARKNAGLTQEQLAEKLLVSRQAITKWESEKGLPDIENLKRLSQIFGISIDDLLSSKETEFYGVYREQIGLGHYEYHPKLHGVWRKKTGQKDMVVLEKFPDAQIHRLICKQVLSQNEKILDNLIGFLTDAPFGIPELIYSLKNLEKEFYLICQGEQQFFTVVTDEWIESRKLPQKISEKKFQIGDLLLTDCGVLPK